MKRTSEIAWRSVFFLFSWSESECKDIPIKCQKYWTHFLDTEKVSSIFWMEELNIKENKNKWNIEGRFEEKWIVQKGVLK